MKKKSIINLRILLIVLCTLLTVFSAVKIKTELTKPLAHVKPSYEQISVNEIINKKNLTDDDYKTLFYQTGLGRDAIDFLLKDTAEGKNKILKFQENLFKDISIYYEKITPITYQESILDKNGQSTFGTDLALYDNGYILLTRATHSLGWRHGHAAIVIDAEKGYTLEAAVLGENSQIMSINKWKYYPNFIILKLKDTSQEKLNEIAEYAAKKLYKVPYKLTIGIFSKKYNAEVDPIGTHCSHLTWYPFMKFGYDLDSDGGLIVTPKDIANSPLVEIVQVYGFDPKKLWE